MRYFPGDVYGSIENMKKREDAMDMLSLGTDGVFRTYGLHPPEYTEPYVLDYRQLDPDQLLQYITDRTKKRPSWKHSFDLANLPDSRSIMDKKQLWEPADLDAYRQKLKERPAKAAPTSPRVPMEQRAASTACWEISCFSRPDCTGDKRAICESCQDLFCERYARILPKPYPGKPEIKRDFAPGLAEEKEGE
jgi:hypothetical protein